MDCSNSAKADGVGLLQSSTEMHHTMAERGCPLLARVIPEPEIVCERRAIWGKLPSVLSVAVTDWSHPMCWQWHFLSD